MHPTEYKRISREFLNKKFSVLLPFLNEEKIIVRNVKEVIKAFEDFGIKYELILIDDGSTDNSFKLLKRNFGKLSFVKIVRNHQNFGKGWALKTGYEFSTGDYILFLDSDLELSPYHLPNFLRIMKEEKADAVIGSKLHSESVLRYPLKRRIISLVYYFFIKLFFGLPIMDTQTGIKLFKREALEIALPKVLVKKFAFDIELLIILHKNKKRIASAPVELKFRRGRFGNIKSSTVISTLIDTLAVFYRDKILHFYNRPMGFNSPYRYSIILFPEKYDSYEKRSLLHFLNIQYNQYEVILIGKKNFGINHPLLKFYREEKDKLLKVFELIKLNKVTGDILVFSTLEAYPDERFLLSAGRIFSISTVGGAGGFLCLRNKPASFEKISYSIIRSFFMNLDLVYRYRPLNSKEVSEIQLNGFFVRKSCLKDILSVPSGLKPEYILSKQIKKHSLKLFYSPDIVLYKKFPVSAPELLRYFKKEALLRAQQFKIKTYTSVETYSDKRFLFSSIVIIFTIASFSVTFIQRNAVYLLPLSFYFLLILASRIALMGFKNGFKSSFFLILIQYLYSFYFLKDIMFKTKKP